MQDIAKLQHWCLRGVRRLLHRQNGRRQTHVFDTRAGRKDEKSGDGGQGADRGHGCLRAVEVPAAAIAAALTAPCLLQKAAPARHLLCLLLWHGVNTIDFMYSFVAVLY